MLYLTFYFLGDFMKLILIPERLLRKMVSLFRNTYDGTQWEDVGSEAEQWLVAKKSPIAAEYLKTAFRPYRQDSNPDRVVFGYDRDETERLVTSALSEDGCFNWIVYSPDGNKILYNSHSRACCEEFIALCKKDLQDAANTWLVKRVVLL
jgi:hypothetical protein